MLCASNFLTEFSFSKTIPQLIHLLEVAAVARGAPKTARRPQSWIPAHSRASRLTGNLNTPQLKRFVA
jgi:hypothetical protein